MDSNPVINPPALALFDSTKESPIFKNGITCVTDNFVKTFFQQHSGEK